MAEGSRDWGAARLSVMEADALAESFRPSWETDWGADEAPPTGEANPAQGAARLAVAPEPRSFEEPTPPLASTTETETETETETGTETGAEARATPVPGTPSDDTLAVQAVLVGEARAKRNLALAAGAFVIALLVIMAFMLSGGDEPTSAPTASAPPATDPAPERATPAAATEDPPEAEAPEEEAATPEPVLHRLTVRTEPANATLTLDGEAVPNPLTREVEADEAQHRLVATADGHREASVALRFDQDHEHVLRLEAEPPPPPAPMRATAMRSATTRTTAMRTATMHTSRTRRRATMRTAMRGRGAGFTTSNPY